MISTWTQMNYKEGNPWSYYLVIDTSDESDFLWNISTQRPIGDSAVNDGILLITEEEYNMLESYMDGCINGNLWIQCYEDERGHREEVHSMSEILEGYYFMMKALLRRYNLEHIFDGRCIAGEPSDYYEKTQNQN